MPAKQKTTSAEGPKCVAFWSGHPFCLGFPTSGDPDEAGNLPEASKRDEPTITSTYINHNQHVNQHSHTPYPSISKIFQDTQKPSSPPGFVFWSALPQWEWWSVMTECDTSLLIFYGLYSSERHLLMESRFQHATNTPLVLLPGILAKQVQTFTESISQGRMW